MSQSMERHLSQEEKPFCHKRDVMLRHEEEKKRSKKIIRV